MAEQTSRHQQGDTYYSPSAHSAHQEGLGDAHSEGENGNDTEEEGVSDRGDGNDVSAIRKRVAELERKSWAAERVIRTLESKIVEGDLEEWREKNQPQGCAAFFGSGPKQTQMEEARKTQVETSLEALESRNQEAVMQCQLIWEELKKRNDAESRLQDEVEQIKQREGSAQGSLPKREELERLERKIDEAERRAESSSKKLKQAFEERLKRLEGSSEIAGGEQESLKKQVRAVSDRAAKEMEAIKERSRAMAKEYVEGEEERARNREEALERSTEDAKKRCESLASQFEQERTRSHSVEDQLWKEVLSIVRHIERIASEQEQNEASFSNRITSLENAIENARGEARTSSQRSLEAAQSYSDSLDKRLTALEGEMWWTSQRPNTDATTVSELETRLGDLESAVRNMRHNASSHDIDRRVAQLEDRLAQECQRRGTKEEMSGLRERVSALEAAVVERNKLPALRDFDYGALDKLEARVRRLEHTNPAACSIASLCGSRNASEAGAPLYFLLFHKK